MDFILIIHHVQKSGGTSIINALLKNKIKQSKNSPIPYSSTNKYDPMFFKCGEFVWNEPGVYGLHKKIQLPYKYIIPIREPISRTISYLHQSCEHTYPTMKKAEVQKALIGWKNGKPLPKIFWETVIKDINNYVTNNIYIRSLVGKYPRHNVIDNSDLDKAIEILEKDRNIYFIFQNNFEYSFNNTMKLLDIKCVWNSKYEGRVVSFDYKQNLSENLIKHIAEENKLDIQLYNYIQEKYILNKNFSQY